jgi:TonB family protein
MSRLTKRYLKSAAITAAAIILIIILPVFNYRKKEIKASVHQNAEIAFVTVKKKTLSQKQLPQKELRNIESEKTIPLENSFPQENESIIPEESSEYTDEGVSDADRAAIEKATSTYKEYVLSRIAAKKTYPVAARAKGMEGRVKIHIAVLPSGELKLLEIKKECPHAMLNEAALSAVKKAAPFKKMPKELRSTLDFVFAMDYLLDQN